MHAATATSTLECKSCGAALAITPGLRTTTCVYCTSPSVIQRPASADRPDPTFVIGFVVSKERALDIARNFIKRPLFAPTAFKRATPDAISGLYLPVYIYSGAAFSKYSANIGENYTVTETYTTTDSQGRTVTRTRQVTKTEWRPLSGQHATYVHDRVVTASRGIPNHELEAIEPFDLRALHRYTPKVISGWTAEEPSLAQAECIELARKEAVAAVGAMLGPFMPGDSHNSLRYETWLEQEHLALTLLPIWVLAVRYREDKPPVRLLVNGQTGRIFGRAPRSWVKITILVLAIVLLIAAVFAVPVARLGDRVMSGCQRCESPLEDSDLRCAICSLPTAIHRGANATVAEVLRCDECGAAVSYDVSVQAPRCAFCGSVMHLERSEDPIEEAQAFLPFRVDPSAAHTALKAWLGTRGFFSPSDLKSAATLTTLRPIWWVGWIFDCEALVSWTADSDYGAGRSAWAPHSGQSPLSLSNVLVSASRGLSEDETRRLTPHFDLSSARSAPHAMEGAVHERFDVQRSAARAILAQAVQGTSAGHARGWIPGSTYRNLRVSALLKRLTTRRVALPSYVLAYHYSGKLYRVVVHGQDPRCLIGESPFSYKKLALVIAAVLLGIGVIVALVFLVMLLGMSR